MLWILFTELLLMSTHNIYFCEEIRKKSIIFFKLENLTESYLEHCNSSSRGHTKAFIRIGKICIPELLSLIINPRDINRGSFVCFVFLIRFYSPFKNISLILSRSFIKGG